MPSLPRLAIALGLAAASAILAVPAAGATATGQTPAEPGGASDEITITAPAGPGLAGEVALDADLYLPTEVPAPAVILAHGFGGSKNDLVDHAEQLQAEGYVVLAYSARGFGESTGEISVNSLDREIPDARAIVDLLAAHPDVRTTDGDPEVGVVGGSYGGALALMLGATDPRVDAVVAFATWNSLAGSLVPNGIGQGIDASPTPAAMAAEQPGVFKEGWAAQFFGAAAAPGIGACGRFSPEHCAAYSNLVSGGPLDPGAIALFERSSPRSVLDGMTAPTLLLQGTRDTLFGLDQADASARQIASAGAPVRVTWFDGGHDAALDPDGGESDDPGLDWLRRHLPLDGGAAHDDAPQPFRYTVPATASSFARTLTAATYPGLGDADPVATRTIELSGGPSPIANPPGGVPAAVTAVPGGGGLLAEFGAGIAVPRPGQSASFVSDPLGEPLTVVGSAQATVSVSRIPSPDSGAPADAVLYVGLYDIGDEGRVLPGGAVSPIRVPGVPADGTPVAVPITLPATAWQFAAGHRLAIQVSTTDSLYRGDPVSAQYLVDAAGALTIPLVGGTAVAQEGTASPLVLAGIVGVLAVAAALLVAARLRARAFATRSRSDADAAGSAIPLVLDGISKGFPHGQRAVDDLSFTVEKGQILGLLGPNGAGKTTALRLAVGLLRPDAGSIRIFGELVRPGAPVLGRVGCFIEGPGFLPHLSGRRNLELYWAASGRDPKAARMDEALSIAALGSAVERTVRGYSQGMRQRLAIAQAMLGMPELLILDEPTNGLDPPQIRDMRGVLKRYAATGRTVIVSSHLLSEVEQTCTRVVVMSGGKLVASGTVSELGGESGEVTITVSDADAALDALRSLRLEHLERLAATSIRVQPGGDSVEAVVTALVTAGLGVRAIVHGRHLEETFLQLVDR